MRRLPGLLAVGLVMAATAATAATPASLAVFARSRTSTGTFTTGSILPPTSLGAGVGGTLVTLTWTPTTSAAATGYDVLRSTTPGSGFGVIGSVTPASATSTTDSPGSGTWYYALRSVLQGWISPRSNEASATIGGSSTGFTDCSSNAADTGGDGNGYETTPGNGCTVDGASARDDNSGTNNVLSCSNAGKDRHRFWGYAFGLPGSVASIDGIQVNLDAGLNNNGGSSILCVELSWDGGTSWTAPTQLPLTGAAVTSYALGAPNDTWGHAWTPGQLAPASFRVRITDASTQTTKQFRLDGVTVQVTWTP